MQVYPAVLHLGLHGLKPIRLAQPTLTPGASSASEAG
jgi:hypothetical protein